MASANQFTSSWAVGVGLNNVGSYQVSGRPFASGSVNATSAVKVSFPNVTKWVQVINKAGTPLKVGFSEAGVRADANWTSTLGKAAGVAYFTVQSGSANGGVLGKSEVMEIKVSQLWLSGSSAVEVVAGLTNIYGGRAATSTGPNWSGSIGVG
mgnify:FL=1